MARKKDKNRYRKLCGVLKTWRFVFSASVDIQAENYEKARKVFDKKTEIDLGKKMVMRGISDEFEV